MADEFSRLPYQYVKCERCYGHDSPQTRTELPCFHKVCSNCYSDASKGDKVECPLCHKEFDPRGQYWSIEHFSKDEEDNTQKDENHDIPDDEKPEVPKKPDHLQGVSVTELKEIYPGRDSGGSQNAEQCIASNTSTTKEAEVCAECNTDIFELWNLPCAHGTCVSCLTRHFESGEHFYCAICNTEYVAQYTTDGEYFSGSIEIVSRGKSNDNKSENEYLHNRISENLRVTTTGDKPESESNTFQANLNTFYPKSDTQDTETDNQESTGDSGITDYCPPDIPPRAIPRRNIELAIQNERPSRPFTTLGGGITTVKCSTCKGNRFLKNAYPLPCNHWLCDKCVHQVQSESGDVVCGDCGMRYDESVLYSAIDDGQTDEPTDAIDSECDNRSAIAQTPDKTANETPCDSTQPFEVSTEAWRQSLAAEAARDEVSLDHSGSSGIANDYFPEIPPRAMPQRHVEQSIQNERTPRPIIAEPGHERFKEQSTIVSSATLGVGMSRSEETVAVYNDKYTMIDVAEGYSAIEHPNDNLTSSCPSTMNELDQQIPSPNRDARYIPTTEHNTEQSANNNVPVHKPKKCERKKCKNSAKFKCIKCTSGNKNRMFLCDACNTEQHSTSIIKHKVLKIEEVRKSQKEKIGAVKNNYDTYLQKVQGYLDELERYQQQTREKREKEIRKIAGFFKDAQLNLQQELEKQTEAQIDIAEQNKRGFEGLCEKIHERIQQLDSAGQDESLLVDFDDKNNNQDKILKLKLDNRLKNPAVSPFNIEFKRPKNWKKEFRIDVTSSRRPWNTGIKELPLFDRAEGVRKTSPGRIAIPQAFTNNSPNGRGGSVVARAVSIGSFDREKPANTFQRHPAPHEMDTLVEQPD